MVEVKKYNAVVRDDMAITTLLTAIITPVHSFDIFLAAEITLVIDDAVISAADVFF